MGGNLSYLTLEGDTMLLVGKKLRKAVKLLNLGIEKKDGQKS